MTLPDSTETQSSRGRTYSFVVGVRALGRYARPWLWQLTTAALLLGITLIVLRPFAPPMLDPTADDIQQQWNDSISRLGIEAVFPPEEDFYVGDIWAVVSGGPSKSFLGKAVRIDQLDMRQLVESRNASVPIFAETTIPKPGEAYTLKSDEEVDAPIDNKHVLLTVTAFPGVAITHVTKVSTFLGLAIGSASAERGGLQIEETKIPFAETYGVPVDVAVGALDRWCNSSETNYKCTYNFAHRMLLYTLGSEALGSGEKDKNRKADNNSNDNKVEINIVLIMRVFVTRELDNSRITYNGRSGNINAVSDSFVKTEQVSSSSANGVLLAEANSDSGVTKALDVRQTKSPNGGTSNSASLDRSDENAVGLRQIFPRPVVFGFRSVSIVAPGS